jgi:hypothetical protein
MRRMREILGFLGWLRTTWFPYTDRLGVELGGAFLDDVAAAYTAVRRRPRVQWRAGGAYESGCEGCVTATEGLGTLSPFRPRRSVCSYYQMEGNRTVRAISRLTVRHRPALWRRRLRKGACS